MPLTREPRNKDIYTDEVDQKGGYVAKVRDKEARANIAELYSKIASAVEKIEEILSDIADLFSSATPSMDGTASAGSSTKLSRDDHVHPTDTSRQAAITAVGMLKGSGSAVSAAELGPDYTAVDDTLSSSSSKTWSVDKIKQTTQGDRQKTGSIVLSSANWSGSGPFTQTVTITGATITANTKVDVQPGASAISAFVADDVAALYVENNNGVLTAYAIGRAPTSTITVQCTYYEVT
jgi:hypothetical protein